MKFVSILMLALVVALTGFAGQLTLRGKTDQPSMIYRPGEPVVMEVTLYDDEQPVDLPRVSYEWLGDGGVKFSGEAAGEGSSARLTGGKLEQPGFLRVYAKALDAEGKPLKNGERDVVFGGGAMVEPETLRGTAEPKDFDAFWARQKEKLAAVPMEVLAMEPVKPENPEIELYDVKIASPGAKPVSGYFSKPKNAAVKSLPAYVTFLGYGVHGAPRNEHNGAKGLSLAINALGIENGRPAEYYNQLRNGELKGYGFDKTENSDPETTYFNGMLLRVMRALEFIKAQPEWDGRTLIVDGYSQGGFQAIAAAGLDPAVTECHALKPWLADMSGCENGRMRGWRPDYTPAFDYYDTANFVKRFKGKLELITGMADYTCTPSSVMVIYNNAQSPASIEFIQGVDHGNDHRKSIQKFQLKK